MVNTLANQTVIILGGSTGIGLGVAKHILETTKAKVIIGSSSSSRVNAAVSTLSTVGADRVMGHTVNLDISTSETAIVEFFEKVGEFNHLIYTAADSLTLIPISKISKTTGDKAFGIRYWSLLATIRCALPYMPKSRESSITVTSGTAVSRPMKGWGASMVGLAAAVEGLARGLAVDLAPIRVNCVEPGGIPETELWSDWSEEKMKELIKEFEKRSLTGTVGGVEDVAEGYGYFVRARHTTGQTIIIDGGEALC
jgi:NAD(P)-dependent dehydrogenase (short-subunit alcohol dehydrogenase family)